jgi:general secretion pathway protein G
MITTPEPEGSSVIEALAMLLLMVVLLIIGVLAALIVPNVLNRADDARITAARTDVSNLMNALKLYRLDNQNYPTAEQGLNALVVKPSNGPAPQLRPPSTSSSCPPPAERAAAVLRGSPSYLISPS